MIDKGIPIKVIIKIRAAIGITINAAKPKAVFLAIFLTVNSSFSKALNCFLNNHTNNKAITVIDKYEETKFSICVCTDIAVVFESSFYVFSLSIFASFEMFVYACSG